jgi:hypothetical protein
LLFWANEPNSSSIERACSFPIHFWRAMSRFGRAYAEALSIEIYGELLTAGNSEISLLSVETDYKQQPDNRSLHGTPPSSFLHLPGNGAHKRRYNRLRFVSQNLQPALHHAQPRPGSLCIPSARPRTRLTDSKARFTLYR